LTSWTFHLMVHPCLRVTIFLRHSTPHSHHYWMLLHIHLKILRLMMLPSLGDLLGFLLAISRTSGYKRQSTWTTLSSFRDRWPKPARTCWPEVILNQAFQVCFGMSPRIFPVRLLTSPSNIRATPACMSFRRVPAALRAVPFGRPPQRRLSPTPPTR